MVAPTMRARKHIAAALLGWAVMSVPAARGGVPQIVSQPQNQMVITGSNVTFSVSATGGSLQYQWYFDQDNAIPGATAPSLTLLNVQPSYAGTFSVIVTNLEGSTTSSNADLTVLTVTAGLTNPYAPGTLGYDLFQGTFT